jgi:hypothetical protein
MALTSIARACTETFDERKAFLLSNSCHLGLQSLRMVLIYIMADAMVRMAGWISTEKAKEGGCD